MKNILVLLLCSITVLVEASTNPPEPRVDPALSGQPAQSQSQIRDYLEMASYVATVALAVFAFCALKQIRLARSQIQIASDALVVAKDDIKIRSRREAIALAAKHCEDFADVILPKLNTWHGEFGSKGIIFKDNWELLNKNFDDTSLKNPKPAQDWVQLVKSKNLGMTACNILNQCEAFAIYFASGAADEGIAFPVVGPLFCKYVEQNAPFLIHMRSHRDAGFTSGKYANTVRLYEIWADRIRLEEIDVQTQKTEKERGSLKKDKITPIGA